MQLKDAMNENELIKKSANTNKNEENILGS